MAMEKAFRVVVFGKAGCEKCKVLHKRLDDLLQKPEWSEFDKTACDVETEDGLVTFCRTECVNPQRIPAFIVTRYNPAGGSYEKINNPSPGLTSQVLKKSKLYSYVGLQTDYTEAGQGVITPKMITAVLEEAKRVVAQAA